MSATLKTYDDGSELTVGGAVALVGICLVVGAASATVTVKVSDWRRTRWLKKHGHYNKQFDGKKHL